MDMDDHPIQCLLTMVNQLLSGIIHVAPKKWFLPEALDDWLRPLQRDQVKAVQEQCEEMNHFVENNKAHRAAMGRARMVGRLDGYMGYIMIMFDTTNLKR